PPLLTKKDTVSYFRLNSLRITFAVSRAAINCAGPHQGRRAGGRTRRWLGRSACSAGVGDWSWELRRGVPGLPGWVWLRKRGVQADLEALTELFHAGGDAFLAPLPVGVQSMIPEKLAGNSMKDWITVLKAADAAARWHVHQRRKGATKEPYINHLLEV